MKGWSTADAKALTAPQQVQVATRRADGTLRRPRTIWIVGSGDRVFVRSTTGRGSAWFQAAVATGGGQIDTGGAAYDVLFTEVRDDGDLVVADGGYRTKYGRYASIVDHLVEDGPRAATLEVHPA